MEEEATIPQEDQTLLLTVTNNVICQNRQDFLALTKSQNSFHNLHCLWVSVSAWAYTLSIPNFSKVKANNEICILNTAAV